jgi:hypothetical protein
LPNAQTQIIARFRRRTDAEAQMRVLTRLNPAAIYQVMFDGTLPDADPKNG